MSEGFDKTHVEAVRSHVKEWMKGRLSVDGLQVRLRYENTAVSFIVDRMSWAIRMGLAEILTADGETYVKASPNDIGDMRAFVRPEPPAPSTVWLGQFTEEQLLEELRARASKR